MSTTYIDNIQWDMPDDIAVLARDTHINYITGESEDQAYRLAAHYVREAMRRNADMSHSAPAYERAADRALRRWADMVLACPIRRTLADEDEMEAIIGRAVGI